MNLQECFLKLASIEEQDADLYKKFSENCAKKLKPTVLSFSKEEENHKVLMIELSNDEKLKEKQLHKDIEKVLESHTHSANTNKRLNLASEKDFFGFALQLEKSSIEIYTELLNFFESDSYEYKSFEALIKEEKKHMLYILNRLYELK